MNGAMNGLKRNATSSIRQAMAVGQVRVVLFGAAVAALFAAVGLFHAMSRVSVVRAGYELGVVERTYRELLREQEHLKLERATLRSAQRLEAIARSRLGMVSPSASQIVVVDRPPPAAAVAPAGAVAAVDRPGDTRNP